jgi:hypothetical protein
MTTKRANQKEEVGVLGEVTEKRMWRKGKRRIDPETEGSGGERRKERVDSVLLVHCWVLVFLLF